MTAPPLLAIVDDDAPVRHATGRLVRSFDLAVELYPSGQELLQSPSLGDIACVITDVEMSGMNGFALCAALRARGLRMPVIFMTAFATQGYEDRARAAGAAGFIHKPFEDTELFRCIEQALSASGS